nr:unnamed protein product [Digitaria exilis]
MDARLSLWVKDVEGNPVFSLVNKASGLAVQHSSTPSARTARGDTQSWKILYWNGEANKTLAGLETELTCRIYCKADQSFRVRHRLPRAHGSRQRVPALNP